MSNYTPFFILDNNIIYLNDKCHKFKWQQLSLISLIKLSLRMMPPAK